MNPPDPLPRLFEAWKDEPPPFVPPMAAAVRRRLSKLEAQPEWRRCLARMETAFSRPAFAMAFITACVLLGLFLAEVRITYRENERIARIEQDYLRLIDPLIAVQPPAPSEKSP